MPTGRVGGFTTSGVPFDIVELPTPEIEPGGLLVKNTHAVICGSDLHGWRGDGDVPMAPVRKLTGHEFTGVVHSLGKGVVTDSLRRPLRSRETAWRSRFSTRAIDAFGAFGANITLAGIAVGGTRWTSIRIATLVWRITTISRLGTYVFKVPDELPSDAVPPVNWCSFAGICSVWNGRGWNSGIPS